MVSVWVCVCVWMYTHRDGMPIPPQQAHSHLLWTSSQFPYNNHCFCESLFGSASASLLFSEKIWNKQPCPHLPLAQSNQFPAEHGRAQWKTNKHIKNLTGAVTSGEAIDPGRPFKVVKAQVLGSWTPQATLGQAQPQSASLFLTAIFRGRFSAACNLKMSPWQLPTPHLCVWNKNNFSRNLLLFTLVLKLISLHLSSVESSLSHQPLWMAKC